MMAENLRIAICVPTSGLVKALFTHSLANLMASASSIKSRPGFESVALTLFMQETSVIHMNREELVKQALKWEATHVMFLDDDMYFPPEVLDIMLGRRQPFVACNYPKRGFPISFIAIRPDGKGTIRTEKDSTGLEEANYAGFGVSLFEAQIFEKTARPWFLPMFIEAAEDNPFCERVRQAGFKVYVDHDASKLVGHVGTHVYSWQQWTPPPLPEKLVTVVDNTKVA